MRKIQYNGIAMLKMDLPPPPPLQTPQLGGDQACSIERHVQSERFI